MIKEFFTLKKIALLAQLTQEEIGEIERIAPDYQVIEQIEEKDISELEIVFGWDEKLLEVIKNPNSAIQWIQYPYAGVDHLSLDLLEAKNIQLTSGSGTNAHAVAESAIAMMLGLTRNIVRSMKQQEKKKWIRPEKGYELKGKTLLIVGAGNIGERIGAIAQALLMETIGINRSGRKIQHMDEQYQQKYLAKVMHKADIVINILPATEETKHLFDATLFSKMKDETIFVNVGRGETVVTEDLLEALEENKISQAALDVFEEEPLPKEHTLWEHERVLVTPHIAGQVYRQLDYVYPIFIENLKAYLRNQEFPYNFVDFSQGY